MNRSKHPLSPDSQASHILAWLVAGHTLTGLMALRKWGVLACSQRVGHLRRRGHPIRTAMVEVGKKRVALYWLPRDCKAGMAQGKKR